MRPAGLLLLLLACLGAHYRLERLQLVDLFPQTFHIEAVATLAQQAG